MEFTRRWLEEHPARGGKKLSFYFFKHLKVAAQIQTHTCRCWGPRGQWCPRATWTDEPLWSSAVVCHSRSPTRLAVCNTRTWLHSLCESEQCWSQQLRWKSLLEANHITTSTLTLWRSVHSGLFFKFPASAKRQWWTYMSSGVQCKRTFTFPESSFLLAITWTCTNTHRNMTSQLYMILCVG